MTRRLRTAARGLGLEAVASALLLTGCAAQPSRPLVVEVPIGVTDARARFGEIYCTVLEQHGPALPDYRPCAAALSRVPQPPSDDVRPVALGPSQQRLVAALVPGIGYGCVAKWLRTPHDAEDHLRIFGYDLQVVAVDPLSGSTTNARLIRDAILALPAESGPPRTVLLGYSKGLPDILEAVVSYPEIRGRIAAVVGLAGAVGGSPMAEDATEYQASLFRHFPAADCDAGDGQAVASLRPDRRKSWLAANPLPSDVWFYSLVTVPDRERISRALEPTYQQLAKTDPCNDGQVICSDQLIPGSTLLGFVNADHWAVALPIDRTHPAVGALFVNHNDYPREALLEAILRFVEEDLAAR